MTPDKQERLRALIEREWQNLLDKDDRTSPEEYPDMALITFEEFADAMTALDAALVPIPAGEDAEMVRRLQYRVQNPSAWEAFEEEGSRLCEDAAARLSALSSELEQVRARLIQCQKALDERVEWHKCSCPEPCDDYNVFPGGCAARYGADYRALRDLTEKPS